MVVFIIFILSFIVLASLICLANTILVGILTHFYGEQDAIKIATAIGVALRLTLSICTATFVVWAFFSLFGPVLASIMLVVAFAVFVFFKSFSN